MNDLGVQQNAARARNLARLIGLASAAYLIWHTPTLIQTWQDYRSARLEQRLLEWHLGHLPPQLQVVERLDYAVGGYGWGPGGNSAVIITYALPGDIQAEIKEHGPEWFDREFDGVLISRFENVSWQETPVPNDSHLWNALTEGDERAPTIYSYMGHPELVPRGELRQVIEEIDSSLLESGSYFTQSFNNLLIVMPGSRRVAFVFD